MRQLRDEDRAVTHDVLDGHLPVPGVRELRAALVAAGVLDDRDERLVALER